LSIFSLTKLSITPEQLLKIDQLDALMKHLFDIEEIIDLYNKKQYNQFLQKTAFKIENIKDKGTVVNLN
jgi:hypothetical protein